MPLSVESSENEASSFPVPAWNDGEEDDTIGLARLSGASCCNDDNDAVPAAEELPPFPALLALPSLSMSSNTDANADWLTLAVILRRCEAIVADADAAAASMAPSIAPPL